MNIIILGAGEIGFYLGEQLSNAEHNVTILEANERVAADANEKLDARVIEGNGSSVSLLEEASVADCDLFLGLSSHDNTNVMAASLAKALGAKRVIARVHSITQQEQWLFDYRKHFGIDYLFSTERLAAVELAKFIRNPGSLIVEEVAGGRIELQQLRLHPKSPAVGKMLKELGFPPRIRIGCIQRGRETVIPSGEERLLASDLITVFGNPRKVQDIMALLRETPVESREQRVVIFGGGEYGVALAQMLEAKRFRVRIFERCAKRCEELSRLLGKTTLINADATSMRLLREEQVGEADFFVAATLDDEDNVMTCLQAKDLGVKHCITLIHRADYADTVTRAGSRLGILGAVSPRVATKRDLMRFMTTDNLSTLINLAGDVDVVEVIVAKDTLLSGKKIKEIGWPEGSGLVGLTKGSSTVVPAGEDELNPGDSIIALVSRDARGAFSSLVNEN